MTFIPEDERKVLTAMPLSSMELERAQMAQKCLEELQLGTLQHEILGIRILLLIMRLK